jgi:hypothetical protein
MGAIMNHQAQSRAWTAFVGIGAIAAGATLAVLTVHAAFPHALNGPPTRWTGPVFTQSQNYSATPPNLEPANAFHNEQGEK